MPGYNGQILPLQDLFCCHGGEDAGADQVLSHHREAGGVPVQPVGAAEDEGLFLLFVVPGQGIGQGVCVVVHGGMDGHAGGLVEDDDVLVLIDDIQRQMDGRDFFGDAGLADAHGQCVPLLDLSAHIIRYTIYKDALGHPFYGGKILAGVALPPEHLLHPKAVLFIPYYI